MDFTAFLIQILNGLQYGLLLFLTASGLTLVFGIMGVINLAHGAFTLAGAYLAWWLSGVTGSFWAAIALAVPVCLLLGMGIERFGIGLLYRRNHLQQVLFTYGLILVLNESRSLLWGNEVHGLDVPPLLAGSIPLTDTQTYPLYRLFVSLMCLLLAAGLHRLIQATRLGMAIRAGASNREMVAALGIDIRTLFRIIFALGVGLAAFAGMIAAPLNGVHPGIGDQTLILSLVVITVGGIGSIRGAFWGALLIGLADTFGAVLFPQGSGITLYALMTAVLLWRPQGLSGAASHRG